MTDAVQLTPKQREVADLIEAGDSVAVVAKKLKIKPTGVYGHLRRMKEVGYVQPRSVKGSSAKAAHAAKVTAPASVTVTTNHITSNGQGERPSAISVIEREIADARDRLSFARDEIASHQDSIEKLNVEMNALVVQIEKLDAAGQALT